MMDLLRSKILVSLMNYNARHEGTKTTASAVKQPRRFILVTEAYLFRMHKIVLSLQSTILNDIFRLSASDALNTTVDAGSIVGIVGVVWGLAVC